MFNPMINTLISMQISFQYLQFLIAPRGTHCISYNIHDIKMPQLNSSWIHECGGRGVRPREKRVQRSLQLRSLNQRILSRSCLSTDLPWTDSCVFLLFPGPVPDRAVGRSIFRTLLHLRTHARFVARSDAALVKSSTAAPGEY